MVKGGSEGERGGEGGGGGEEDGGGEVFELVEVVGGFGLFGFVNNKFEEDGDSGRESIRGGGVVKPGSKGGREGVVKGREEGKGGGKEEG